MNKSKISLIIILLSFFISISLSSLSSADSLKAGEEAVFNEFRSMIPKDKIKTIDDLYHIWQEVQSGKKKAIIIDIRTEAEFDAGHILDSSNLDSGYTYVVPKKIEDINSEIWVFCRTKHRATYFAGILYKYGYKNVYVVDGGIKEWGEKGYPLVNKYLGEIKVVKYADKLKEDFWYRDNK